MVAVRLQRVGICNEIQATPLISATALETCASCLAGAASIHPRAGTERGRGGRTEGHSLCRWSVHQHDPKPRRPCCRGSRGGLTFSTKERHQKWKSYISRRKSNTSTVFWSRHLTINIVVVWASRLHHFIACHAFQLRHVSTVTKFFLCRHTHFGNAYVAGLGSMF